MRSKSYVGSEPYGGPGKGRCTGGSVQNQVDSLLFSLKPNAVADERRRAVFDYVQEVIQQEVPDCKIFPVGSFPLKTYLPYADVDMVMFPRRRASNVGDSAVGGGAGSTGRVRARSGERMGTVDDIVGGDDGGIADAVRPSALFAVNKALCMVAARAGVKRRNPLRNRPWTPSGEADNPEIRNVQFINARTPVVTVVVGNVVVDITENQGGSVAASALLEEADNLIQRDHLFKRSLLLLKAWAWCETPRLVGIRVLGAQRGGLTSYGLSVMVLHLFALRSSAETLLHPLDVLVRFFEVYSEFDWSRYCLTLDGPVPLESVREPGHRAVFQGEGERTSRLQPLVRKVLAELSPVPEEREKEKGNKEKGEKEKQKEKGVRRGRRASRFGRHSDGRGKASSPANVGATSAAASAATAPHFPKRDCNIQDPLNALNNLGHSVTKNNLKALESAIRQGRQQLEAWQLLSTVSPSRLPRGDDRQRRPSDQQPEASRSRRLQGGRTVEVGAEDRRAGSAGFIVDPSPVAAAPAVEQVASASRVPRQFGPLAQYVLTPPLHSAYSGASMNAGGRQPVLVPGPYPLATREGRPIVLAYPQPFMQAAPQQNRFAYQPQPYMVPHGHGRPGMLQPYPAVLVPAHGAQARPELLPQWPLQGALPVTYQGHTQLGGDHHTFARMSVLPSGWRDHATARSEVLIPGPEFERQRSASRVEEMKGFPNEKESCTCEPQKLQRESHDSAMQEPASPWDSRAFVNASRTSSTASLSDFHEDGSKDGQDCQLQYESGAENDLYGRRAKDNHFTSSSFDGFDHSDAMMDTRHAERGDGHGAEIKTMDGNLWTNSFLQEFFPECCQRYGAGDGFRDDLLDHPCQRRSKLQEAGSPRPRQPGAPDVLKGASRDVWNSLKTVGTILRETAPQTNGRNVKEVEARAENGRGAIASCVRGKGGESGPRGVRAHDGHDAEAERRVAQVRQADGVARACTGGGGSPASSTNSGSNAHGVETSRPKRKDDEVGNGRQCGVGPNTVRVSVDDETGYTTSEEQGDREEATPPTAPPSPPVESSVLAERSAVSASTQTARLDSASAGNVGIEVGVQSSVPIRNLLVSTASQCERPARVLISTGVQCGVPASGPLVSGGSQPCRDTSTRASIGVQCALLVQEDVGGNRPVATLSPTITPAGVGAQGSATCSSKSTAGLGGLGLPRSPVADIAIPAAVQTAPSAGFGVYDGGASSKSARRRKKAKAAAQPASAEDTVVRPSKSCSAGVKRGLTRGCVFCGVIGLVLAAVWGWIGCPEASWQGGGLLARRGPLEDQNDGVQPPVWVVIGGSLTLGDEVSSRRRAAEEDGAGGVQWFKDGRLLAGQTRSFLTISAASAGDEGTYECFAVEESGRIGSRALWEEAKVRISEAPTVESQLQTQRLARGEMLAIMATASGVPQPEYQWRLNGVPIPGANRPMLVKHGVSEADTGTYTCDVFNVAGSAQWEEMAVILREDRRKRR